MGAVRLGLLAPAPHRGPARRRSRAQVSSPRRSVGVSLRLFGTGLLGRTRLSLGPDDPDHRPGPGPRSSADGLGRLAACRTDGGPSCSRPNGAWPSGAPGASTRPWRPRQRFSSLAVGELLTVRREGEVLLDLGRVSGVLRLSGAPGRTTTFAADLAGESLRVAALAAASPVAAADPPAFGLPTDLILRLDGSWNPGEGRLDLARWSVTTDGAAASGTLAVADLPQAPRVDLSLEVQRVDFARVLEDLGARRAGCGGLRRGARAEGSLGSASLSARVTGRLAERGVVHGVAAARLHAAPAALAAPSRGCGATSCTRSWAPGGTLHAIQVSPASPDFIPLARRAAALRAHAASRRGLRLLRPPRRRPLGSALGARQQLGTRKGPTRGASTITPAARQEPLLLPRETRGPQAPGAGAGPPPGVDPGQGAHPRDLPERHRVGPRPLRPAPGRPALLRLRAARPDPRPGGVPGFAHPGAGEVPALVRRRAGPPPASAP